MKEFVECDTCRARPGSPPLCSGCLSNRAYIEELERAALMKKTSTPGKLAENWPEAFVWVGVVWAMAWMLVGLFGQ